MARHHGRAGQAARALLDQQVTEHGQPVAQLGPRPVKRVSIIDQMIADGRATAAKFDHRKIPPPLPDPDPSGPTLTEILLKVRDEERR